MFDILKKYHKNFNLNIISDEANWVFKEESKFIRDVINSIMINNYDLLENKRLDYYIDRYKFFKNYKPFLNSRSVLLDYFHGEPKDGTFYKKCFDKLKKNSKRISLIRVPNKQLFNSMDDYGINFDKNVAIMPIPVNTNIFKKENKLKRDVIRKKMGIPKSLFLIGSFQKDGIGWGEGFDPKLIKGPDIFLKSLESLFSYDKSHHKNIGVLLTGPSRGYMKKGLEKMKIKYWHKYCNDLNEVSEMYAAIDAYFISSRLEGGPKSFLESISSLVPVISTPVGQVVDLYKNTNLVGKTFQPEEYGYLLNQLLLDNKKYMHELNKHNIDSKFYSIENQFSIWKYKLVEIFLKKI